jgi:hypothetical protein
MKVLKLKYGLKTIKKENALINECKALLIENFSTHLELLKTDFQMCLTICDFVENYASDELNKSSIIDLIYAEVFETITEEDMTLIHAFIETAKQNKLIKKHNFLERILDMLLDMLRRI